MKNFTSFLSAIVFIALSFSMSSCGKKDAADVVITDKNLNEQLSEGFQDVSEKDFDDSITRADKVIQFNPNIPEAYFNRGMAKVNSKDKQGGLSDFRKAQELYKAQNNKIGLSMVTRAIEVYSPQKKTNKK
ncbi:MAG: hypothetical protein SFU25_07705 [Candidatus Caenarcaniphilales bacterium]|nr:hypothetical protein [Candidatus Caenarcaniphilales bacterium]